MKSLIVMLIAISGSFANASGGGEDIEIIKSFGQDLILNNENCILSDDGLLNDSQKARLVEYGYEFKVEPSGLYLSLKYAGGQSRYQTINGKQTVTEQHTYTLNQSVGVGGLGGVQIPIADGIGRITSKKDIEDAKSKIFDVLIDTLPECAVE